MISLLAVLVFALTMFGGCGEEADSTGMQTEIQSLSDGTLQTQEEVSVKAYPIDLQYTEYIRLTISEEMEISIPEIELPSDGIEVPATEKPYYSGTSNSGSGAKAPDSEPAPDAEEQAPDSDTQTPEPEPEEEKKTGGHGGGGHSHGGGTPSEEWNSADGEDETTDGEDKDTDGEDKTTDGEDKATDGEDKDTDGEDKATDGKDKATDGKDKATDGEDKTTGGEGENTGDGNENTSGNTTTATQSNESMVSITLEEEGQIADAQEEAAPTSDVIVFRAKIEDDSEEGNYALQVQMPTDGQLNIFHGLMVAAEYVEWDVNEVPFEDALISNLEDVLLTDLQWHSCAQNNVHARDQEMVQSVVSGQNVIYVDASHSKFQVQTYDDNGCLFSAARLSWGEMRMLQDSESGPIDWIDDISPVLRYAGAPVVAAAADMQSEETDSAFVIVCVLAGILAASNLICLYYLRGGKKGGRGRKSGNKTAASSRSAGKVSRYGTVHNIGARSGQQDSFDVINCSAGTLAVVADGMGGLKDGDKVSQKIVETMRADSVKIRPGNTEHVLCQMVAHANREVNRMLGMAGQYKCGSTLLAVLVENDMMQWITVGDSRIYLYRGGSLLQINREHIYRAELLERAINGKLSFADALRDPQVDRLSSFIGMGELKHVDICLNKLKLCADDRILLMSDGVFNALSDNEIAAILRANPDAAQAAGVLEEKILQKHAPNQDNFTCVILEV